MRISVFLRILPLLWLFGLNGCGSGDTARTVDWQAADWAEIEQAARGSTVNFMMWQGSPRINDFINNYAIPTIKAKYDINLRISGGQGPEIVQLVMSEKQAGAKRSQVDMVWINGETFFQLKQIDGLYGPFVQQLPHAQYIDFSDPYISIDFQQPIDNMETPWGISQFALFYDSARVTDPPRNLAELETYVKQHPGTFTISNDFTGMTLLKSFLAELSGSPNGLNGPFDEAKYERLSNELWAYLNRLKPYFWKGGSTFPKEHAKMDQMFATGEILLSYGFGEGGIEEKIQQGLFPTSTRAYAWANGTVLNANYLGIPYNAANIPGALVVINFLISPEAQLQSASPAGMNANTILDLDRLPEAWQAKFDSLPPRKYGATMNELKDNAMQEPAPEYMLRLYEEFRTEVIEQ